LEIFPFTSHFAPSSSSPLSFPPTFSVLGAQVREEARLGQADDGEAGRARSSAEGPHAKNPAPDFPALKREESSGDVPAGFLLSQVGGVGGVKRERSVPMPI